MLVEERIQLIRCDKNLRFVVHSILFCELNSKITINRTIDSTKYKSYITSYGVLGFWGFGVLVLSCGTDSDWLV